MPSLSSPCCWMLLPWLKNCFDDSIQHSKRILHSRTNHIVVLKVKWGVRVDEGRNSLTVVAVWHVSCPDEILQPLLYHQYLLGTGGWVADLSLALLPSTTSISWSQRKWVGGWVAVVRWNSSESTSIHLASVYNCSVTSSSICFQSLEFSSWRKAKQSDSIPESKCLQTQT